MYFFYLSLGIWELDGRLSRPSLLVLPDGPVVVRVTTRGRDLTSHFREIPRPRSKETAGLRSPWLLILVHPPSPLLYSLVSGLFYGVPGRQTPSGRLEAKWPSWVWVWGRAHM